MPDARAKARLSLVLSGLLSRLKLTNAPSVLCARRVNSFIRGLFCLSSIRKRRESETGKLKLRLIVVILIFLVLLPTSLQVFGWTGVSPQETTSEITVPWASSSEADGYIKAGEWDDALEKELSNSTWEADLYIKQDNKSLYVFIDFV